MQITQQTLMASDIRHDLILNQEKTLEKIYAKAYPMVLHYVKKNFGTDEDAQDLLQESVILFYEKVVHDHLVLTSSVTTYIMGICKNKWLQELDRRNRQQKVRLAEEDGVWEEPQTDADKPEESLISYVEKLGEKCKDILVSFYYTGQRMEQITEKFGYRNIHTATVQKFKCLERLRNSLASFSINHFK